MLRTRPERLHGPDSRRGLWTRGIRLASGYRSIDDGVQRMLSKAKGMRLSGVVATCVAAVFVLAFGQAVTAQDETPAEGPAAAAGESPAAGDAAAVGDPPAAETDSASPAPAAGPDAPAANQPEPPTMSDMLVPIIGMGLIFYFIVLAPQKKARKKQQAVVDSLQKHDRVVSIGGIVGTIVSFDTSSDEVLLEVAPGTQIRMLRRSIQGPKAHGSDEDGAGDRAEK